MSYLKPLYAWTGDASDEVVLHGGECVCGHVFFPMQAYGCEVCGRHGQALQPMALRGRGRLIASATVHIHADKARPAPFTIGEIVLDQGPTVRTLLADGTGDPPPGAPMRATLVRVGGEIGDDILDLRFAPLDGAVGEG